ncbi:MAG: hypothetical protein H6618_08250 [Deltaproteobacteria bacterium]|nr:hypothetical protein [Deltaproteobacteria bacterium]
MRHILTQTVQVALIVLSLAILPCRVVAVETTAPSDQDSLSHLVILGATFFTAIILPKIFPHPEEANLKQPEEIEQTQTEQTKPTQLGSLTSLGSAETVTSPQSTDHEEWVQLPDHEN